MSEAWPDIFYEGYIHQSNLNPLTKFTSSSRKTEFKDILPWNISQMITKIVPISTRIVISYEMKRASRCQYDGKSMETEKTTWSEFPNGGKAIVEQILALEERNKSESRTVRITIWDPSRKVNHKRVHQIYPPDLSARQKHWQIGWSRKPVYVRWNGIKNCAQRRRLWLLEKKEVRNWVK